MYSMCSASMINDPYRARDPQMSLGAVLVLLVLRGEGLPWSPLVPSMRLPSTGTSKWREESKPGEYLANLVGTVGSYMVGVLVLEFRHPTANKGQPVWGQSSARKSVGVRRRECCCCHCCYMWESTTS